MKIKKFEIAIAVGLIITVMLGFTLAREQSEMADKLIRLHVVANSDGQADQMLKLKVRDAVLDLSEGMIPEGADAPAAERALLLGLDELVECAKAVVTAEGYDYDIDVRLGMSFLDTRVYDDFSLPAGDYRTLRVTIGDGAGQNWWCVLFPPLCTAAATGDFIDTAEAAGFTQDEISVITADNQSYAIKFKSIELVSEIKQFLKLSVKR